LTNFWGQIENIKKNNFNIFNIKRHKWGKQKLLRHSLDSNQLIGAKWGCAASIKCTSGQVVRAVAKARALGDALRAARRQPSPRQLASPLATCRPAPASQRASQRAARREAALPPDGPAARLNAPARQRPASSAANSAISILAAIFPEKRKGLRRLPMHLQRVLPFQAVARHKASDL